MGHAADFADAPGKQRLVARVVVHHQVPLPVAQKVARMLAAAPDLIVEHGEARPLIQVVAAVGSEVGAFGFALAGIELLHGRFIGVQHGSSAH